MGIFNIMRKMAVDLIQVGTVSAHAYRAKDRRYKL